MNRAIVAFALASVFPHNTLTSTCANTTSPLSPPYRQLKRRRRSFLSSSKLLLPSHHVYSASLVSSTACGFVTPFFKAHSNARWSEPKAEERGCRTQGHSQCEKGGQIILRNEILWSTRPSTKRQGLLREKFDVGRKAVQWEQQQELENQEQDNTPDQIFYRPLPFMHGNEDTSMITNIKVDNLAMVESVQIELARGLIAITGETGAGKSLISSAFSLAAGTRVRGSELVGSKGPTARVQLDLMLGDEHMRSTREVLRRIGVPVAGDGRKLSVARTMGRKGSSASVNGCIVKVGTLRELMSPLIHTVDSNAFELFSRADGRLRALDRLLAPSELILAIKVKRAVSEWRDAEAWRTRLEQRCRVGDNLGGEEDSALLTHWVKELDDFQQEEAAYMAKMSAAVHAFIADWGDDMLGPLAEVFVSNSNNEDNRGGDFTSSNTVPRELALLWPCLSHIRDSLKDIENSRTKVVLARQAAADTSNNESIASAVIKIRNMLIDTEIENVGLSKDLLEQTHDDLNSLEAFLNRLGQKLERAAESLPVLPFTFDEVEERILKWKELSRKHGVLPERLGLMQEQLRNELDEIVTAAEALPLARDKEDYWRTLAEQLAGDLSSARRRAASELELLINPMMADVGLNGAIVKVTLEESKTLGTSGMDRVQFVMEANDGHTRGTVEAVASSGEKSRLLLLLETSLPPPPAIVPVRQRADGAGEKASSGWEQPQSVEDKKCVGIDKISKADKITPRVVPCAVLYDEIDAHVGGRTAVAVGRLLANQGRESQVVVVTHTASVAVLADQHLVVEKAPLDSAQALAPTRMNAAQRIPEGSKGGGMDDVVINNNEDAEGTGDSNFSSSVTGHSQQPQGNRSMDRDQVNRGMRVAIREVRERERELEVGRMAAGDMGGEAASELARTMLLRSRRQVPETPVGKSARW